MSHFKKKSPPPKIEEIPDGEINYGKALYYNQCASCHNLDDNNNHGPGLRNVFMRKAGSKKGYYYSVSLMRADFKSFFSFYKLNRPSSSFPSSFPFLPLSSSSGSNFLSGSYLIVIALPFFILHT